ncbi:nuclear factor of activated T-cells, cytoplasmic 3-like protein [Lates japonicus]|uniref:Nuclear factor of activated T-cells, cytoplasmic 3-like protein n=1 Tax=Lates japonicus TaxID=270547 RepID=A0AAD3RB87_LATJO|nr:nuclear factor of activated T-cells, cytoplasmic 3-like protein [Lates japonicus]
MAAIPASSSLQPGTVAPSVTPSVASSVAPSVALPLPSHQRHRGELAEQHTPGHHPDRPPLWKRRAPFQCHFASPPSPSPTPSASPRGSVTDDTWVGSPAAGALGTLLMAGYQELDVPSKTRRTSGSQLGLLPGQGDPGLEAFQDSPGEDGREQGGLAELFLQVPSHFSWNKPKPGNPPLFRTSSPPPLDWPLPCQFDQCELKLEVQPKSYHRAHYETEGSRGSIKAATGGHPVVKLSGYSEQPISLLLFIGTADDRYLRPHSFYQVHRVAEAVTTTRKDYGIDCAGILKLRNADIELKKGETDIGRKNTRVRVVFRVAIPQSDGRMLWLQTVSIPVECSQRSGQELPQVESFSPASCSVDGGEELLITGSNISTQSRVVFMEKTSDGRSLWEMDARVVLEKSSGSSIVVEVPPYNKKTAGPVQVQFYVSNGKRRRSLTQSFTFLPAVRHHLPPPPAAAAAQLVKQEHWELDHISHNPPGFSPDTFTIPPQISTLAPQASSVPLQTFTIPPQTSSSSSLPPSTSPVGPQREQPPSLSSGRPFADPQKDSLLSSPEEVLNIKQEPEDQPNLASLGLREITLDDVNEIIDRDIGSLSGGAQPDQFDQFDQYDWEHKSDTAATTAAAALPFPGGGPQ